MSCLAQAAKDEPGKRSQPESTIKEESARAEATVNTENVHSTETKSDELKKSSIPIMKVQLCNRFIPALLDTGASISVINGSTLDLAKSYGIKIQKSLKEINLAAGGVISKETIT